MLGIEVKLADGTLAYGVKFESDGAIYVHEPISDTYASEEDLRADFEGISVQIIGLVMPLQKSIEMLEANYQRNVAAVERASANMYQEYQEALNNLKRYMEAA